MFVSVEEREAAALNKFSGAYSLHSNYAPKWIATLYFTLVFLELTE